MVQHMRTRMQAHAYKRVEYRINLFYIHKQVYPSGCSPVVDSGSLWPSV